MYSRQSSFVAQETNEHVVLTANFNRRNSSAPFSLSRQSSVIHRRSTLAQLTTIDFEHTDITSARHNSDVQGTPILVRVGQKFSTLLPKHARRVQERRKSLKIDMRTEIRVETDGLYLDDDVASTRNGSSLSIARTLPEDDSSPPADLYAVPHDQECYARSQQVPFPLGSCSRDEVQARDSGEGQHVHHTRACSQPTMHRYIPVSRLAQNQKASTSAAKGRPWTATSSDSPTSDSIYVPTVPPKRSLVRVRVRELLNLLLGGERGNKAQRAKAAVGVVRQASLKRKNTTSSRKAQPHSPTIRARVAHQMHGFSDKASPPAQNPARGSTISGPRLFTPQYHSRKSSLPSFLPIS